MPKQPTEPAPQRRISYGVVLVAGAYFMEMLDGTVIATALPRIAVAFHTTALSLNIGITAYLLAVAVCIPATGWLADRVGTRTVFAWSIGIFTFASMLCGLATSVTSFVLARILQGIGGAMMVPVGRLVVLHTTERKDLLRWIAWITWPGLVAPVLGPPLGGWIVEVATWRWIFFLNLPLGVAALGLTFVWIDNRRSEVHTSFDWRTFTLFGIALTASVTMLEYLSDTRQRFASAAFAGIISLTAGWSAIRVVRSGPHPLFGLEALKIRSFAVTIYGGSFFRIAISVSPFLLPLMFQLGFGVDAFHSGILLLALFAGNLGMKPLTTPVLRRFGFKRVLIVSSLCTAAATMLCGFLSPSLPLAVLLAVLVFNGACRSMQFTSLNTLAFAEVPKELTTDANTLQSTVHQLSLSMGAAVGALAISIARIGDRNVGSTPALKDFHVAFLIVGGIALLSIFDILSLPTNAGEVTTKHNV